MRHQCFWRYGVSNVFCCNEQRCCARNCKSTRQNHNFHEIYFIGMFWILLPPAVNEIEGMSMFCKWCMPFGRPMFSEWVCVWLWSYLHSSLYHTTTFRCQTFIQRTYKNQSAEEKNGFCTNFDIPTLLRWLEANVLWQLCFVCKCSLGVFVRSQACAIIFIHCVITS